MEVTQTLSEGLKREFKVVVPAAEVEKKMSGRLDELSRQVRIPGFRPGKVPVSLLRKRYGDSVRGEVLSQAIDESWQEALTKESLRPASQPKIEIVEFKEGADLEYKMAVELIPEIPQPTFGDIQLDKLTADVADDEVDKAIQRLADARKSFEAAPSDHAAASGDRVKIDFVGKVDDKEFPGGSGKDMPVEIGAGMFIPGFAEQLEGLKAGDKKELKVKFPETYPVPDLAGKDAVFDVEAKAVESPVRAAIDEEFAKSLGAESLDQLKEQVKAAIARDYAQVTRTRLKRSLLDALSDKANFELPPSMVDQEFEAIWARVKEAMDQNQLDPEDQGKSEGDLREQYRKIAERRVRLGLLLSEVGRANNIKVTQEDLNRAMAEEARRYPGQERRVLEFYRENQQAMQNLQAPIFEDKVVDFVLEMAKISEKKVSVEELLKDPDAPEPAAAEASGPDEGTEEAGKKKPRSRKKK
jgi:trigger factor